MGRFSLRSKILLVLTILPLLVLIFFGGMAMSVFETDKLAYIFESSNTVSRTLALQTQAQLESVLGKIQPIYQERVTLNRFGPVTVGLFSNEKRFEWIGAYSAKPTGGFELVDAFERVSQQAKSDAQGIPRFSELLDEATKTGRVVTTPWRDDLVLMIERVGDKNPSLYAVLVRLTDLRDVFRTPGSSRNVVVNAQGNILFSTADLTMDNIGPLFQETGWADLLSESISQTLKGSSGEDLLVSFSPINLAGLSVVSMISKKEALSAVRELINKSVLFIVMLLALVVIFGVVASNRMTQSLMQLFRATKSVSQGEFNVKVNIKSRDEIGSLAESFNAMAQEVQRLLLQTAENARMQSELKTAQTVQETLFPPAYAKLNGGEIFGFYEPASECGGDWWHYSVIDGKIYLWIGDATGHGAPAALLTSATKSAATMIEMMKVDPAQALTLLNQAIYDVSRGKLMMTFFLGCVDPKTGIMTYANASHEAPYLMKANEKITRKSLIPLNEVTDPRLGHKRETVYQQKQIQLEKGDRILFFTDGISEIPSPQKDPWGEREFIKALVKSNQSHQPVRQSVEEMVSLWSGHRQSAQLVDDITLFLFEFQGMSQDDTRVVEA